MGMVISVLNIIDALLFKFIGFMIRSLYNLIIMLADANFFDNEAFKSAKDNIFGLIGLFMVFKITFSIIQYITNPDKITDSQAGAGKILTKIVIVLVLLGTVNTIFEKAFELQSLILRDAVLERLVFGQSTEKVTGNDESNTIDPKIEGSNIKTSDYLAYSILAPFVTFNTDEDIWGDAEVSSEECDSFIKATNASAAKGDLCNNACTKVIQKEDPDAYNSMCEGLKNRNMYEALKDVAMLKIKKKAVLHIDGFFGILVGGICIVVLIIIAVGVAIRSVKLSFLNIIAPLPIISYIEPKDNSNSMFNKWVKETIKTFLELFIRLISFYFAILVITKVLTNPNGIGSYSGESYRFSTHPLVVIFLIIGCFLFALQLPKLIENLFGGSGGLSRDAKSTGAIAAGLGGIAGGIVGGAFGNMIGTGKAIKDANGGHLGIGGVARSAFAFGTGAVGTGLRSIDGTVKGMKMSGGGLSSGGLKGAVNVSSSAIARTGAIRNARNISYETAGGKWRSAYSPVGRNYGRFAEMAGIKDQYSPTGRVKGDIKNIEGQLRDAQNEFSRISSDRMAAMQQYNQAVAARQKAEASSPNFDEDMFKQLGGTYNNDLNDFMFNVNGVSRRFNELSYQEYKGLYTSARKGVSANDLAKFDSEFNMTNSTNFSMLKGRVEDEIKRVDEYNRNLKNATSQETYWKTKYDKANEDYVTYQTAISNMNKDIATKNKQVETIAKAMKKS